MPIVPRDSDSGRLEWLLAGLKLASGERSRRESARSRAVKVYVVSVLSL